MSVHKHAAAYAARHGVKLSVEPLNRFECYVLNTVARRGRGRSAVEQPNYGLLYDTFHANIEEKDPVGVIAPNMRADQPCAFFRERPRDARQGSRGLGGDDEGAEAGGYDGWCVIEAFGRAFPALAAATRVWRDFFPNREEVYRSGKFLREQWAKA